MPHPLQPHRRYLLVLVAIYALLWTALAIAPVDRKDWALENALVLAFGLAMAASARHFVFSRISYSLIFLFLCLHAVGAHYTYSEVPYERAWQSLTGQSLNQQLGFSDRNHFDRAVHFAYGLLLAYPLRELFLRLAEVRGFWGYFLPLDFTLASSALFELFEWGAAEFFGGDLGVAYLGSQGDVWDAQKDMALAGAGALLAMLVTVALNLRLQRDFAREWADSLKVKDARPAGEDEIRRLLAQQESAR
ncbi:MAG: DUF2238 domain-containing protein [Stagnimonas sp.]|nr:DUF2238 domain-containing protein [Stagnimonas sp.]